MTSPVGAAVVTVDQEIILDRRDRTLLTSRGFTTMVEKDQYKAILGDGNARVSVGFDENVADPNSYSSVKVRVNVTITCDQNRGTIQKAQEMAFQECVAFSDDAVKKGFDVLVAHLKQIRSKEE